MNASLFTRRDSYVYSFCEYSFKSELKKRASFTLRNELIIIENDSDVFWIDKNDYGIIIKRENHSTCYIDKAQNLSVSLPNNAVLPIEDYQHRLEISFAPKGLEFSYGV